jgi:hypothetical protein
MSAPASVEYAATKEVKADLNAVVMAAPLSGALSKTDTETIETTFQKVPESAVVCHLLLQAHQCLERDNKKDAARSMLELVSHWCDTPGPSPKRSPDPDEPAHVEPPQFDYIRVGLWTDTDDKDNDDEIRLELQLADSSVASRDWWGKGETWGDQEDRNGGNWREVDLKFSRSLSEAEVERLSLVVKKRGSDDGWAFKMRANIGERLVLQSGSTYFLGNGSGTERRISLR